MMDYWMLYKSVWENQEACLNFIAKLRYRFGYAIRMPTSGHAEHLRGKHNGPYWSFFQPIDHLQKPLNLAIAEEWKALVCQGVRLRRAVLDIDPEFDLKMVFPLNLMERR